MSAPFSSSRTASPKFPAPERFGEVLRYQNIVARSFRGINWHQPFELRKDGRRRPLQPLTKRTAPEQTVNCTSKDRLELAVSQGKSQPHTKSEKLSRKSGRDN
jgi:hypothetical protein